MKEVIQINNLKFSYKKNELFDNLSLTVLENDIVGVLGHNGAGKTTLFKLILKLLVPCSGTVEVNNYRGKPISFLSDNNGLYPKLTVYENLKYRAMIYKIEKKYIDETVHDWLHNFNIYHKRDVLFKELSHGLKRRVSLIATFMQNSEIIILDEPTTGIDPESVSILCKQLNILKNQSKTVLISSHELDFISKVCNKFIIINNGELVYADDVPNDSNILNQIYLKYATTGGNDE